MTHTCGRRNDRFSIGHGVENEDEYHNNECSYCGGISGDLFMERLRKQDVVLGPTDKNYKVYVTNKGGDPIGIKFYFQHLSDDQQTEFINLLNAGKIELDYPQHFYVLPYFICIKGADNETPT